MLTGIARETPGESPVIAVLLDLGVVDKPLATYPAQQDFFLLRRGVAAISVALGHAKHYA
jgi:hypothetical protein